MAFIPTTVSLTIPATFSPPTTCFPSEISSTYTLAPDGPDSQLGNSVVIRSFNAECYPPSILSFNSVSNTTITAEGGQVSTALVHTATLFSATSCPSGFVSRGGERDELISYIHCCPSGPFTLQPVSIETYSGCIQTPTAPVILVQGTSTVTLATPSDAPYGISYRPLEIGFMDNGTTETTGLSTGAQAGIGVGVALFVVILVAIGGFMWWTKKRKSGVPDETNTETERGLEGTEAKVVEVPADGHGVHELSPDEVMEADGDPNSIRHLNLKAKASGHFPPAELEGDFAAHEVPVREKPSELPVGTRF